MKAILKQAGELRNQQILAATNYCAPEEILEIFSQVSGKKIVYIQISNDQYTAPLPPSVAQELLEDHLFVDEPGYYLGESLEPSLDFLDSEPNSFERFVQKNLSTWEKTNTLWRCHMTFLLI